MIETELINGLIDALGLGSVIQNDNIDARYCEDWSGERVEPPAVLLRPADVGEVSAALRLCHAAGQPVTVQGGRTGLVAGALPMPGEILLSTERLNQIGALDPHSATIIVDAGVPLQALQEHVDPLGYVFPLDLGARGSCTIGGNIATNAGGNRVLRYGMMRDMVLGLTAVLADGRILDASRTMLKDNAGYDLRQLFIGSEGTLGVVTSAVLRLRPRPTSEAVAFCAVPDYPSALALLNRLRSDAGDILSAFEMMWGDFYSAVLAALPDLRAPLSPDAFAYVLVETQGYDPERDGVRLEALLAAAIEAGELVDGVLARSDADALQFWAVRDGVAEAFRAMQPCFSYDVSMANRDIAVFAVAARDALARQWPEARQITFGHIGDGNLHMLITTDDAANHAKVDEMVYRLTEQYGGSISAEHGIGRLKLPYLGRSRSEVEIATMAALKSTLDPKGILGRNRIFPWRN